MATSAASCPASLPRVILTTTAAITRASAIMISPTFIRSEFRSLNTRLPSLQWRVLPPDHEQQPYDRPVDEQRKQCDRRDEPGGAAGVWKFSALWDRVPNHAVLGVGVIDVAIVLVGVAVIVVVLVLAFVPVLAELVLDYLIPVMLVVLGDPPVGLFAVVVIVAYVLIGVAVIVIILVLAVIVVAFVLVGVAAIVVVFVFAVIVVVLVLAVIVVAFVLIGMAVIVVLVFAVIVVAFVLVKDADLPVVAAVGGCSSSARPGDTSSGRPCWRTRGAPDNGSARRSRGARARGGAGSSRCTVTAIFNPDGPIDLGGYDLYVVLSGIADHVLDAALIAFYRHTIRIECLTTFVSDEEGKEASNGWWCYVHALVHDAPLWANDREERCVSSRWATAREGIHHPTSTTVRDRRRCRTCGGARRSRCARGARASGCLPPCRQREHQEKGEGC